VILELLGSNPFLTNIELANLIGFPRPSVRRVTGTLVKEGLATRVKRGVFKEFEEQDFEHVDEILDEFDEIEDIPGWYMSGLAGYNRNIGVKIYGIENINEANEILREYGENFIDRYNPDFYGIGSIPYDGFSPLDEVIEVNL